MTLILIGITPISNAEFSAVLETELGLYDDFNAQKFEVLFEPEWNLSITENVGMTFIGRARFDGMAKLGPSENRPNNFSAANGPLWAGNDGEVSIREWYVDTEFFGAYWRIGKQQVVWGQADGLKVLDTVNPQSYREFILDDFEDSRIPLWMINAEVPIGEEGSLQILWIPDTSYDELAETDTSYEISSPLRVPKLPQGVNFIGVQQQKPSSVIVDSDIGFRYSTFSSGWDLTFNYLYHYQDSPVLYQDFSNAGVVINSTYKRNHLLGTSASKSFGDFTLRAELGYSTDSYHLSTDRTQFGISESTDISSVIGLDWHGLSNTLISGQWFQSHLFDYENSIIRPQNNHVFSFLYNRTYQNETWELEIIALHGTNQNDGSVQAKINHILQSNVKTWLGTDVFYGHKEGLFGQFKNANRLTVGIEWGF